MADTYKENDVLYRVRVKQRSNRDGIERFLYYGVWTKPGQAKAYRTRLKNKEIEGIEWSSRQSYLSYGYIAPGIPEWQIVSMDIQESGDWKDL